MRLRQQPIIVSRFVINLRQIEYVRFNFSFAHFLSKYSFMKSQVTNFLSLFTVMFFILSVGEAKVEKTGKSFILTTAGEALKTFEKEGLNTSKVQFDYVFLKLEKTKNYQVLDRADLAALQFDVLTQKVLTFLNRLNTSLNLPINTRLRKSMQLEFYGLSQAIKKANELTFTVQADHFDKLHDMLMGQGLGLFYSSSKDKKKHDLFFASYYLRELEFPMDMVARHLEGLKKVSKGWSGVRNYSSKMARLSLHTGGQLNKLTSKQADILYEASMLGNIDARETQLIQKIYLKQLQMIGDQEKIKAIKKELASNILWQEAKNVFSNPLDIFKFIQFCVGYVFIAWPLEVIVIMISIVIFGFQASAVLTLEEKRKNSIWKKLWLMFTKAYLGSNVPFFSKLAASLVLFGIGLYFNSAKNFVETMMANI